MDFVRKAGNIYADDVNLWMSLASYKLPSPKVKSEQFLPGGGIMELDVPLGSIEPLVFQFNTKGMPPTLHGKFGMSLSERRLWTVYELLQDELTGVKRERIITMRGVYGEADPDEMKGRGMQGYAYHIKSITEYEDVVEGHGVIARFNFSTNSWQGYGQTVGSAVDNRILRIAG